MNKEFISFEQSKILKHDLDYSGESLGWYSINKELNFGKDVRPYEDFNFMYPAPTFSQAFRWFRENHLLLTSIFMYRDMNGYIFNINEITHDGLFVKFNHLELEDTYEEAELACLKKLIEIVKSK